MAFEPAFIDVNGLPMALHPAPGLEGRLKEDVALLAAAGVAAVVTTLTEEELTRFGIPTLGQEVEAAGMQWVHLPVQDKSLPDAEFDAAWAEQREMLTALMESGKRVSVHCRGGTGRTGLVAAKLLLDSGADWQETLDRVREARPGALEQDSQLGYLQR
ncbi:dual specificity protein phosphatase [Ferrimonas balearica DSM 9799]|uniref:Dual specificity protein phosphatase n=1 Tax=Ferrimonas balearica (strain DSM 9799 / CCM 4581 / KCTC 23876 / PAT) TaxID=550540 RepID=E1SNA7_FERBD|nr:tyrosine-protein phosphatase [Ferrimonas balearica]MBY6018588.1 dual specificity protein phosphatase family protein [Halomonas denitrificans]ADN74606.1 dual specificity protein phosphatase [Ferrimonas balearica DSM 9799]MBW3140419.1 dual specificity protein phosphatase family protein [Ferrimonas balearica]MBW3165588.1 dual specificity protein phosphatase family protein [Ferrimonas balearica]MBY5981188.1 dual specificity protein phosphatase family protein [Ferrimonas balearica]